MEKYIKSLNALNELTLSAKTNKSEIDRFAESDIFWAANKNKPILNRKIKKGNVYQFEFGKNFIPEMSYEHRGLVIGISGKLLYVLPICSFNSQKREHISAYHPIDNPYSKENFFLLKAVEFPFLTHDSVLKLNDIRTVSFSRIKYKQENGYIDPNSSTYKVIEKLVFSKYFFDFSFEINQLAEENSTLKVQLNETNKRLALSTEKMAAIKLVISSSSLDSETKDFIAKIFSDNNL